MRDAIESRIGHIAETIRNYEDLWYILEDLRGYDAVLQDERFRDDIEKIISISVTPYWIVLAIADSSIATHDERIVSAIKERMDDIVRGIETEFSQEDIKRICEID